MASLPPFRVQARGSDLRVHFKNTREASRVLKNLPLAKAKAYMQAVIDHKRCVPFTRFNGEGRRARRSSAHAPAWAPAGLVSRASQRARCRNLLCHEASGSRLQVAAGQRQATAYAAPAHPSGGEALRRQPLRIQLACCSSVQSTLIRSVQLAGAAVRQPWGTPCGSRPRGPVQLPPAPTLLLAAQSRRLWWARPRRGAKRRSMGAASAHAVGDSGSARGSAAHLRGGHSPAVCACCRRWAAPCSVLSWRWQKAQCSCSFPPQAALLCPARPPTALPPPLPRASRRRCGPHCPGLQRGQQHRPGPLAQEERRVPAGPAEQRGEQR